jgi:hypothetical protein
LLLELRWRLFANSLRSRKRQAELALGAISYAIGVLLVLGTSIGLCVGTAALLHAGKPQLLEFLLWAIFLFWQLVPLLFEGYSPGLNFREVARYPVSLRLYLLLNAAYGLFDPAAMAALLWLLSIWIGIVVGRPDWALPAAALFLLFAAFNVLCNRIIVGVFERFQSTRKGRERMVAVLLVLMLVPQMFNLIVNGWINVRRVHVPQWTHDVVTGVRHISPPGLVLESLDPGEVTGFVPLALLVSYFLLAAFLQFRQLRAVYLGEIYAESFKAQRELKVKPGWRLPGVDESVSAIVEKELRYIRQNPRLLVTLVYPVILFAFVLLGGPARRFSFGDGGNLLGVFAAFLAISVSNMSYNTFGMDREGFGRWLLSPLSLQKVMRAKNISQGVLMSAIYLLGGAAILAFGHVPLDRLAAVTAGFFSLLIIHLGAGNLFSVYWPKRIEFTQMNSRMASSAAGFASLLVLLPVVAVTGSVVFATWFWNLSWLPLAAGVAGLALSLKIYSSLSDRAATYAQDHLEEIAGTLGV